MNVQRGQAGALLPLVLFVVVYFGASWYMGDFYAVPVLVVFLAVLVFAFLQYPRVSFEAKLEAFTRGAGESNLVLMILIFLLAGVFGQVSKDTGAIKAAVDLTLYYLPPQAMIAGLFTVACFVSLSLGTSVGTIAALAPVAVGLEASIPGTLAVSLGAVIGGAMLGDNLSFISDTTIAATRSLEVGMKDKFRVNVRIVTGPFAITLLFYVLMPVDVPAESALLPPDGAQLLFLVPYVVVFGMALAGIHVIPALLTGIALSLLVGVTTGALDPGAAVRSVSEGLAGMFELSIICLVIGGLVGIIRSNGGIDFLLHRLTQRLRSPVQVELAVFTLTGLVNLCIANNTITLITVGPIARNLATEYGLDRRRAASIMDTASCFVQGVIPYGAQVLTAVAIASFAVSPVEVIRYLYYPLLTGLFTLLFVGKGGRKKAGDREAQVAGQEYCRD